jgi:hypothetical protein
MTDAIEFVVLTEELTWSSPGLAGFVTMAPPIEARFGPPVARDLDSNGLGLFDVRCLRFPCGLEVALWQFQRGDQQQELDPATEPFMFEIHANQRDLAHIAFHLEVPLETMSVWTDHDGVPLATAPSTVIVMRTDDNGNDVEVRRLTNRCEATALVREYEARAHKQTYWIADG